MTEVLLLVIGFAIGAIGTLVGAGGGFLLVPVLLILYPDDPPDTITSTSLAVVMINAISGSLAYARQGRIDYRTGLVLAVATIPGSVIGALVTNHIDRGPFTILFAAILIGIAALLFVRPVPRARPALSPDQKARGRVRELVDRGGQRYVYAVPLGRAFVISLGVGFLSSLLGIGGGIIQVPIFILLLQFPTYIATATSQFMLMIMSASGTATHLAAGDFGEGAIRTAILAPGVIAGSQVGAWLSRRTRPLVIARVLAIMMTVAGGRMLMSQLL